MNEYDSSRMLDLLKESHGYELTDQESEADLLLLNTCSIREKAQEKAREKILQKHKKRQKKFKEIHWKVQDKTQKLKKRQQVKF